MLSLRRSLWASCALMVVSCGAGADRTRPESPPEPELPPGDFAAPHATIGQHTPVEVTRGPLLFMTRPLETAGGRVEIQQVVDPGTGSIPREFLRHSGSVDVLHRFDQNRFLLKCTRYLGRPPGGLFILHMARGEGQFLRAERDTSLVAVEGSTVYFLAVEHAGETGYKLGESKEKGDLGVESYPQPRYTLYSRDLESDRGPHLLLKSPIERVLEVREEGFWVVLAGEPAVLARVSRNGKECRSVLELETAWIPSLLTFGFSPGGKRLALGVADRARFFGTRDLIVVEVDSGRVIHRRNRIPVRLPLHSSQIASLEFVWRNEDTIRFSETQGAPDPGFRWVDLDIRSGAILGAQRYSDLDLWHEKPSKDSLEPRKRPERWPQGLFDRDWKRVYFRGERNAVDARNAIDNPGYAGVTVSPDGRWGTFASATEGSAPYLVDGETRNVTKIDSGWHYDYVWMPSIR